MKKSIQTLFATALICAFSLTAHAQPVVKIAVVDLAKVFESHYRTVEQMAKLQDDQQKAQDELDKMKKELNTLAESYKSVEEQSKNPTLTADAKAKIQADMQTRIATLNQKNAAIQQFFQETSNAINQRANNFKSMLVEEISKTANEVAKRKGATLLMEKHPLFYSDPAYDITDDVIKQIASERPATTTATAPAASAPAAAAPAAGSPMITVPGVAPKK